VSSPSELVSAEFTLVGSTVSDLHGKFRAIQGCTGGNFTVSGVAEDVDGNGELLLRDHAGELIHITWGSVDYPTG